MCTCTLIKAKEGADVLQALRLVGAGGGRRAVTGAKKVKHAQSERLGKVFNWLKVGNECELRGLCRITRTYCKMC